MTTRLHISLCAIVAVSVSAMAAKPVASISMLEGDASVLPAGGKDWRKARPSMPLRTGDQVYTREESFVEIRYADGPVVRMNENSKLALSSTSDKAVKAGNPVGDVWVNLRKSVKKRDFELASPTAVAAIRGTVFQMQTQKDSSTNVHVFDGTVVVGPADGLKKKIEQEKKEQEPPPGEPIEVPGPEEIPGPFEVPLEEWQSIVAGQMIAVRGDGKFAQEEFDIEEAAADSFVKKNRELDRMLLEEDEDDE